MSDQYTWVITCQKTYQENDEPYGGIVINNYTGDIRQYTSDSLLDLLESIKESFEQVGANSTLLPSESQGYSSRVFTFDIKDYGRAVNLSCTYYGDNDIRISGTCALDNQVLHVTGSVTRIFGAPTHVIDARFTQQYGTPTVRERRQASKAVIDAVTSYLQSSEGQGLKNQADRNRIRWDKVQAGHSVNKLLQQIQNQSARIEDLDQQEILLDIYEPINIPEQEEPEDLEF